MYKTYTSHKRERYHSSNRLELEVLLDFSKLCMIRRAGSATTLRRCPGNSADPPAACAGRSLRRPGCERRGP